MKNVAVIMAGGKGQRFWPMSTENRPKQFLKLTDSPKSMIQLTIDRVEPIVSYDDVFVVTNKKYESIIKEQLPYLPDENIIYEPLSKNTAPCLALATCIIKEKYGDANIVVLASDHVIKNNTLFLENINKAIEVCNDNIVTLGIVPSRIETGYGYINIGDKINNEGVYRVKKFVEKPNYELAKEYYNSGDYLWNSGMFIWKNSTMEKSLDKYCNDMYNLIFSIRKYIGSPEYNQKLKEIYGKCESISIDYAIMEKTNNIYVIPGNFGWDDVGSWLSVERLKNPTENNNILQGNIVELNSSSNIIINDDNDFLVAAVGLEDIIVVKSDKSILIMKKDNTNDIKKLLEKIDKTQNGRYL